MKVIPSLITRTRLAVILAIGAGATVAFATPYATSLTNNAGVVSFRLNEAADDVKVTGNVGTLTIDVGAAITNGLTVTNLASLGMTGGVFQVTVSKVGSGAPSLIGTNVAFNSPRGVAVNVNPKSPYFGRVYVANSAAGTKGDGLFIYGPDLSDTFGQGAIARTGGITNFATGGTSSPMRLKVGHDDDMLYVTDWADATGNLYVTDPDCTNSPATSYALKPIVTPPGAVGPVGVNNTHGSIIGVETTGSLATGDLKIWTIDEDYATDPTTAHGEDNSLWEYDVGAGPLPWNNAPNAKLLTPTVNFVSQTMDMARGTNGYFYVTELRSAGNEAGLFVVDSSGTLLFNSRTESVAEGFAVDQIPNCQGVAVSEDGRYVAVIRLDNLVTIIPLTNGVPNFPARFNSGTLFGTTGNGRGIAFDRADNVYIVSSGLGVLRSMSLGFTATNTTSSDGSFTMATPSTQVTATLLDPDTTVTNTLYEADAGVFATLNVVRTNDDLSGPLTVNFTLTGTATRGTQITGDYSIRTNGVVVTNATSVIIPTGSRNILVNVVANNDTTPELAETIVFSLSGGPYNVVAPLGGTIVIVDDDTNMVDISAVPFPTMFEANTNDFVRFTLQRRGDTNAASFDVNLAYRGTATSNVDYVAVTSVTIDPGVVTKTFDVHPLDDALIEVAETVIVSVTNGTAYLVGTNNALTAGATGTIVDDEVPAETVLFSDNFNTDSSANWTLYYASTNSDVPDYTAVFAFDYSSQNVPPAPHSSGDTLGLMMTVNKSGLFNAAGVNLYPNGRSFSNNFALRFDMYLMQNGSVSTTEYSMCGINHDGTHTNWFRNSGTGVPAGWTFDGVWAYIEADGAVLGDYVLNSAPGTGTVFGPTSLSSRLASTLTTTFHNPPWTSGSGAGAPGNTPTTATPSWAQVELSQIGKIVTLKINNTVIMTYSNTTAFTSGNIMLGYDDAFDSVGGGGGGLVIFDNVRVVSLPGGIQITNITKVGNNAQIDFTWFENDPASAFKLQTAANVGGPYADDANAATTYSINVPAASYRITTPATNTARFLRVRHQ